MQRVEKLVSAAVCICKALPTFLHLFAMAFESNFLYLEVWEGRGEKISKRCQILPSAGNFLKCNFGRLKTNSGLKILAIQIQVKPGIQIRVMFE